MEQFIIKPDVTLYHGIRVDKNTKLEYKKDNLEQTVENLVLKSKKTFKTDDYENEYKVKGFLKEGDILILDEDDGYIKPLQEMYTIEQTIKELELIK